MEGGREGRRREVDCGFCVMVEEVGVMEDGGRPEVALLGR